ncbi:DUF2252_family protein [Hexamita inflata]|uniref:DUF2252 family protein n=1 Tax=Hexamita inflata TaxID=28002 RepID=A0AA86NT28_9EUKA|nr:DUF2252 family protein [Hexamita inflata]
MKNINELYTHEEQIMIKKLQKDIQKNKTLHIDKIHTLYNIEFMNNFDIEELIINSCRNVVPKLNNQYIKKLIFNECVITDLEFILLPNLEVLELRDNQLSFGMHINQFTTLRELSLFSYRNLNLQLIIQLKITKLNLRSCSVYNIDSLQFLKQLTKLSLYNCYLFDISHLKTLVNLKELNISENKIVYLEPLKELKQIVVLNAEYNQIVDISVIKNHPNFSSYNVNYQTKPRRQDVIFANKLRDINSQMASLRIISKLHSDLKSKTYKELQNVDCFLQQICRINKQFVVSIISLFQELSTQLYCQDIQ